MLPTDIAPIIQYYITVKEHRGNFYLHGLTLIPAWISYHIPDKVWDEITY